MECSNNIIYKAIIIIVFFVLLRKLNIILIHKHSINEKKDIKVEKTKSASIIKKQYISKKIINIKTIKIPIAYSTDNQYIYPLIVSMTSLVSNANVNTFYEIYILHSPDFTENSKYFLNSVKRKHPDRCSIQYINMKNKYKGLPCNYKIKIPAYYRLSLQDILLNVEKIIWLDGDTLIFEDLKELFRLNMKGNAILGFLDNRPDALKSFGLKNATVLCSGVLLIDLDGLRKYNFSKKVENFISKFRQNLTQHDQTIINVVLQKKIAPIPPKFGIWDWENMTLAEQHYDIQWKKLKYKKWEFFEAVKHPSILHFAWSKPFWRMNTSFSKKWWAFANLTGYYYEIL